MEFDNDDIIVLKTVDGEEIRFIEIAGIAHNHNFYAILQPVELIEGMEDDEALVFKVTRDEKFEIELDDEIIDAVFSIYHKLLDNQNSAE